jgi:tetratricopeptide (TPR) repeat protein
VKKNLFPYFLLFVVFKLQGQTSGAKISKSDLRIDSLRTVLSRQNADTSRVKTLVDLSWDLILAGRNSEAMNYAKEALSISEKQGFENGMSRSYSALGGAYESLGDYTAALHYDSLGLVYTPRTDKKRQAAAYNNMAMIYKTLGNAPRAMKEYHKAVALNTEINNTEWIGNNYNNIALVYSDQGNYPEALNYHFKALKIREQLPDKNALASSYNNIGNLYKNMGNYDDALAYHLKALALRKTTGNKPGLASSYNNIANVYADKGRHAEALAYHKQSLELKKEQGNKKGMASSYNNIGAVLSLMGRTKEAIETLSEGLKIREQIKDASGIADSYLSLGSAYLGAADFQAATRWLEKSIDQALKINNKEVITQGLRLLSNADSAKGNFNKAFLHYKLFTIYRDSMFNEDNTKKAVQAQMNYEFEKKETEAHAMQSKKDAVALEEKEKQAVIRNSFIAGFIFVLLLSLLILRGYRQKQKANIIITRQKEEVEKAKEIIEEQKNLVEEKQQEILDSIHYAKRIQRSLLPTEKYIARVLENKRKS